MRPGESIVAQGPTRPGSFCPSYEGEVILGTDGRWLGGFDETYYPSPFPTGANNLSNPSWPVGFTNIGFLGQSIGHSFDSTAPLVQWRHGDRMDCAEDPPTHGYTQSFPAQFTDVMIAPGNHLSGGVFTPCDWPQGDLQSLCNSSAELRVVEDASGPTGLESANALEIDFSGMAFFEGAIFVGEGGGFSGAGSGPGPGWGGSTWTKSTTGWHMDFDSCWTIDFWVKPVPDELGFTCTGYNFSAKLGYHPGYLNQGITLVAGWQHFVKNITWFSSSTPLVHPLDNTVIVLGTTTENDKGCSSPSGPDFEKKGRVHVKCFHVYPCGTTAGVHVHRQFTNTG